MVNLLIKSRIPAILKDRRTRPLDSNLNSDQVIYGTFKYKTSNTHDFETPNDPTLGYWKNFCLEDFALFWDLPNAAGAKYVYFQEVDFVNLSEKPEERDIYPMQTTINEAILKNGLEKNVNLEKPYNLYSTFWGGAASVCFYLYYLAI